MRAPSSPSSSPFTPPSELPWVLTPEQALLAWQSPDGGLQTAQVLARQQRWGQNQINPPKPIPMWRRFVRQWNSLLVWLLLAAAVVAISLGDIVDGVVILSVLCFNASLGFYQEGKAEKSLTALQQLVRPTVTVLRDGRWQTVAVTELVIGDRVLLEAGAHVPADGRLYVAERLSVEESMLTGEALAVSKRLEACPLETEWANRHNMVYAQTIITRGRGEMLVTAIGMKTEFGRLTGLLQQAPLSPTPLQLQLDQLGKQLSWMALIVVGILLVLGAWQQRPWLPLLLQAVAVAVAAIPEGLPAVVTVSLAVGMRRMAQHQAVVKRLPAVETLGCTTVICTDKTGTLTCNQMTVSQLWFQAQRYYISGEGYFSEGKILPETADGAVNCDASWMALCAPLVLCNDSHWQWHDHHYRGDPSEVALLVLAHKAGVNGEQLRAHWPRLAEVPFDPAEKWMATAHVRGERLQIFVKGAPEVILARCSAWLSAEGIKPWSHEQQARVFSENEAFARQGLRVLALAGRTLRASDYPASDVQMLSQEGLTFIGLVALQDPPRPHVDSAIHRCQAAGVRVMMLTGDHPITAQAIAQHLGISAPVLTGVQIDALDDAALLQALVNNPICARVTPAHKVRLVRVLKRAGEVVAMTGDGVNDAPALKYADIGIAMGQQGTAVAKEASTIVLQDDNFATLVSAMAQGRVIYANLLNFVRFQVTTNLGALLTVLAGALLGIGGGLSAIQLLWINLIMDGPPALTLGLERGTSQLMQRPPRTPGTPLLSRERLVVLIINAVVMACASLGMYWWTLGQCWHSDDVLRENYANSALWTTFVWLQVINALTVRREWDSVLHSGLPNRALSIALIMVIALQLLVLYWPWAQTWFATQALRSADLVMTVLAASSLLWVDELRKRLFAPKLAAE